MAKVSKGRYRFGSHKYRSNPYSLPPCSNEDVKKYEKRKSLSKAVDKKDWEDATCSVCLEFPHNAVLLLCSSHDKGCRPYMCNTSHRYSNCLNRFKKAYTKEMSPCHSQSSVQDGPLNGLVENPSLSLDKKQEVIELACPLCRGQVKGWTVVEAARKFLNAKKRKCMHDDCSFTGTYKKLKKHVKIEHPFAEPCKVDPMLKQKWNWLEGERDRGDVISTIRTSMPGAIILGDYVIEDGFHHLFHHYHSDSGDDLSGSDEILNSDMDIRRSNFFRFILNSQRRFGRRFELGVRTADNEGDGRINSSITSAGSAAPVSSDANDQSSTGGRVVVVGRSERRRQIRRALQNR